MLKKYRIAEHYTAYIGERKFYVQEKVFFKWRYMVNEFGQRHSFDTKAEAIAFIDGGCKDPLKPTITLHPISIKVQWPWGVSEENLLPCPFCGGEPYVHCSDDDKPRWVSCSVCEADGPHDGAVKDIFAGWNRRIGELKNEE
jgi:Lar family restriction alleviation protein